MHANTIETTANQQGWTLHTGFAGGQWLETSSPAGEDLIIDVPSGRPIPETVHEHAEQFDPDEHVRALVRSPMKGQPGTIAELLEDAKAIQTMLDRLDAALSAPPDDDPHWEQWTAEALDEMLDDVAHKASSLAQTVLWHHHAANHGIETPENTRRQCLDTLDDLRDLMNRGGQPPPPHMTEKKNADGRPVIRKSPRPHQAGGRGRPPAGKGAHTAPLQTPAGPRRRTPPRRRAPPSGTTAKRAKPYQTKEPRRRHVRSRDARPPKGPSSHPVRVHAADTARFPRTEPAPRGGPDHFFLFGRSASPLDHTGVAEPVNAPRNGLRPARSLNDGTRFGR